MITVDRRTGSADLLQYLRGVPAELGTLEFGDVSFLGQGPGGTPVLVGMEIKIVSDVLKCITDGRFAGHQLPGLVNAYNVVYLVIEGRMRRDFKSGTLQVNSWRSTRWFDASVGNRRFMWSDLDRWLLTAEIKGGIRLRTFRDRAETAQFIKDAYRWWTEDGWDKHKSHLAFDESGGLARPSEMRDKALLVRPGLVRMIAAQLPGLGWERSAAAERQFKSVQEMVAASEEIWRKVPGVGKILAERIYHAIRGAA